MTIPDSYGAIYTEMLLDRFLNIAKVYVDSGMDQQQIVENMKTDFSKVANVEFMDASNNAGQGPLNFYYNFANYTILMICVYVIAMIMASFNNIKIKRRNLISKTNYKKINAQLFAGNFCLVLLIWALYAVIALVIYPNSMLTGQGLLMAINSLVFCISALSIGFLIGSLIKSKEATIGISNILALGSSFICGAFVPQEILSSFLLKVGKFLPSYWYIKTNDDIALLSNYNFNTLQPIFINMLIVLGFAILIYVITNITTKLKLKTA